MKVTQRRKITTTFTLNEQETDWLKNIMQNPLCVDEEPRDFDMCKKFFNACDGKADELTDEVNFGG